MHNKQYWIIGHIRTSGIAMEGVSRDADNWIKFVWLMWIANEGPSSLVSTQYAYILYLYIRMHNIANLTKSHGEKSWGENIRDFPPVLIPVCTCIWVYHVFQHGHLHMHVQPFPESSIITSTATVIGNGSRGAMGHMLHLNVYKESTERAHFCVCIHNKVRTHIICMSIHTYVYTMPFVCTFRPSVLLILSQTVVPIPRFNMATVTMLSVREHTFLTEIHVNPTAQDRVNIYISNLYIH